jgi:hypothetical protein
MIVEMDEIDIKDKLNNLRLVLKAKAKAKAKSKYGKGKRKQKVAVHTKTGKVIMATRTVGEGTPVIHGKATPQMLKQAQAKKDAIHNTLRVGGELNIKSLKKQLDISHPNLGITENEIKSHFIVHNETYESSGRGNNKKWRINKHFDLRPIATDHTNPNEPVKAVKEKPKVEKEKSNFSHYEIRYKEPGLINGDPYDGNLEHVKIRPDGTIYEAYAGGVIVNIGGDEELWNEVKQKYKWDWYKVKKDGSEVKLKKIPDVKLQMRSEKEVIENQKPVKGKPIEVIAKDFPDPATVSGMEYPTYRIAGSQYITDLDSFFRTHPDNKTGSKNFHPGLKDPKYGRKAAFAMTLQTMIDPPGRNARKTNFNNITMKDVEKALAYANDKDPYTLYSAYNYFGWKKGNAKLEAKPITLKDVESIYMPCLNYDYENQKPKVKEKPVKVASQNKPKGKRTEAIEDLVKNSNYPISALKVHVALKQTRGLNIEPSDIEKHLQNHPDFKTIKEGGLLTFVNRTTPKEIPAPSKPVKVKKVKKDGSQVSGRGTRKPVDPLRDHAMNRPMMDNFFKEKEAKINQHQNTKGWNTTKRRNANGKTANVKVEKKKMKI